MSERREEPSPQQATATRSLLHALQQAWQAFLLYPAGSRLRDEAAQVFAAQTGVFLRGGPLLIQVHADELVLDTVFGVLRSPAGDLRRYLQQAKVYALSIDNPADSDTIVELLAMLVDFALHPERSAGELEQVTWESQLDGVLIRFDGEAQRGSGEDLDDTQFDLTRMVDEISAARDSLHTAVERENSVNLPVRLADHLLRDLESVDPADPYHRAGVNTLLRIQTLLFERADIAALDWLLDELDRHPTLCRHSRNDFVSTLAAAATPRWFAQQLEGADRHTERALAALALHLPPRSIERLQEMTESGELRAVLASVCPPPTGDDG